MWFPILIFSKNCKCEQKPPNTLRRSHISAVHILLEEFEVSNGIGGFSGDHIADPPELILAVQEKKDVCVRKATFLEFDGVDAHYIPTKDIVLTELLKHEHEF
jgi:hypothetical protein